MNISAPFVHRPVATTLLIVAIALAGAIAFNILPVSPLPQVDFPTISVAAGLPGASPETMASSVATPLERQFGRIAAVTEMTSSSTLGSCSITLQFDLNRNIDAAARDVQAAIAAARGYLPTNLPSNPTYRKVNPADSPIFMLALTSDDARQGQDVRRRVHHHGAEALPGAGRGAGGGGRQRAAGRAHRAESHGAEQIRDRTGAGAHGPGHRQRQHAQGPFLGRKPHAGKWAPTTSCFKAIDYEPLLIAYHNGAAVRVSDVGDAVDSVEDLRNAGYANGKPSVLVIIFRQPGANIIDTVDRMRAVLPQLQAAIPRAIDMQVAMDQTHHHSRFGARRGADPDHLDRAGDPGGLRFSAGASRTTFIPSVAVPVSLIGTFGVMYLCGYSLDNLSLMALTISTGFVVDDAIVVIENITRYLEQGMQPVCRPR